jgi:integrase
LRSISQLITLFYADWHNHPCDDFRVDRWDGEYQLVHYTSRIRPYWNVVNQEMPASLHSLLMVVRVSGTLARERKQAETGLWQLDREAERPRDPGEGRKEIAILTPPQIQAFLGNAQTQKYRTMFLLAVMSGVRQGELLGLQWFDLDLGNSQVHVQKTYNKGRFFITKTKTSNRRIDLGPMVMTELKNWKLACPPSNLDLMFPNEAGEPINYSNMVNRHFLPALKGAGLPKIRFHELRHTYASLLIHQKENIKHIQNQLGHSNPMVTLNVYAHLMESRNHEAACRLENTIFG